MSAVRIILGGAAFLCAFPLFASQTSPTPPPPAPLMGFWPTQPRQGQTLFWRCETGTEARDADATWGSTPIPVERRGGTLLGVVGLKITDPVGTRRLRVRFRDAAGQAREATAVVSVGATRFPLRRLTMKRSTERLYSFPGAKQEDATVSRAVRTRSAAWLWQGSFRLPTNGRFSTPFGVKRIRNRRTVYYHRGLDLAAPEGRPVFAPNHGRVVLARRFRKYGNAVVLDHGGGVTTLYLHMSALHTREGERVIPGQHIGDVGMTGVATGPHLHWALYVHGVTVDPLLWTHLPERIAGGGALAPPP